MTCEFDLFLAALFGREADCAVTRFHDLQIGGGFITIQDFIAAAFALPVSAFAQYEEPDTGRVLMLGAGAYAVTNPYESAKDDLELGALPLFLFQQGRLTVDLSGVSWRALELGPLPR